MREREREREKERERKRERDRERERERERETKTERQRERRRERRRQRDWGRQKDRETWHGSERKKSLHVAIVCLWVRLPSTWSFDVQWVFFVFERHWPTSVCSCGQPSRKLLNRRQKKIKKKEKLKEKRRKLSWNVAAVTRKRGAENYFIWGLSGEELSKLNILSQSKAQCWFRKRKTELKIIEKTKICIPAMLKPYSASSFCLPNKNRVGVAHGDGTNLEVVYIYNGTESSRVTITFFGQLSWRSWAPRRCCACACETVHDSDWFDSSDSDWTWFHYDQRALRTWFHSDHADDDGADVGDVLVAVFFFFSSWIFEALGGIFRSWRRNFLWRSTAVGLLCDYGSRLLDRVRWWPPHMVSPEIVSNMKRWTVWWR